MQHVSLVSGLNFILGVDMPRHCLTMPAPIVFLGDALCSGKAPFQYIFPGSKTDHLKMGMFLCQVFFIDSYESILFFFSIKVLDHASFNETIKRYLVLFSRSICSFVMRCLPFSTIIAGRLALPWSEFIIISFVSS